MKDLTSTQIIDMLGRSAVATEIGVQQTTVNKAAQGKIPASWYARIRAMCESLNVSCPLSAFAWKSPPAFSGDQILAVESFG